MTPAEVTEAELAEMRRQYPYATAEDHMLVHGEVRARCGLCRVHPVPEIWALARWCDLCLHEFGDSSLSVEEFVARKRLKQQ